MSPLTFVKAGNILIAAALDCDISVNDLTAVRSDPDNDDLGIVIVLCSTVFLPKLVTLVSKFIDADVAFAIVTSKPNPPAPAADDVSLIEYPNLPAPYKPPEAVSADVTPNIELLAFGEPNLNSLDVPPVVLKPGCAVPYLKSR